MKEDLSKYHITLDFTLYPVGLARTHEHQTLSLRIQKRTYSYIVSIPKKQPRTGLPISIKHGDLCLMNIYSFAIRGKDE